MRGRLRYFFTESTVLPALVLTVTVALLSLGPIRNADFGIHHRAGQVIRAHVGWLPPERDDLSYSTQAAKWVNFEWLFDRGLAAVYDTGGAGAVVVLRALALVATALLALLAARKLGADPWVAALLLLLVMPAIQPRFSERPHVVGDLLLVVTFGALAWNRGLLWLPPLTALWANLHGSFVLGVMLCCVAFIWRPSRRLAVVGLCTALAPLVNPWGAAVYRVPLEHWMSGQRVLMAEWAPYPIGALLAPTLWPPLLLGVLLCVAALRRCSRDLSVQLPALVLLVLTLRSNRFITSYAWLCAPAVAAALPRLGLLRLPLRRTLLVAGAVVALGLGFSRIGLGHDDRAFPRAAADHVLGRRLTGNAFAAFDDAGYLIGRLHPSVRFFIDGRYTLHGEAKLARYFAVLTDQAAWDRLEGEYDVRLAVLQWRVPALRRLADRLRATGRWRMTHADRRDIVLVRR